jgi:hypothetical protein
MNAKDRENVVKASQTANLLMQDLKELVDSDDKLVFGSTGIHLSVFANEMLGLTIQIEQCLKRLVTIANG